jgi:hypothetical protein
MSSKIRVDECPPKMIIRRAFGELDNSCFQKSEVLGVGSQTTGDEM